MRTVELEVCPDELHGDIISVIPSTYDLCRMYDDKSVRFKIYSGKDDEEVSYYDLSEFTIYIRFISGNLDLGEVKVSPDSSGNCYYELPLLYTLTSKLEIQLIFVDSSDTKSRSNIVKFNLYNSLPPDKEYVQNVSYLNRLIMLGRLKLAVSDNNLLIKDDLDVTKLTIDISDIINPGGAIL